MPAFHADDIVYHPERGEHHARRRGRSWTRPFRNKRVTSTPTCFGCL